MMCCIEAILRAGGYQDLVFATDGAKAFLRIYQDPLDLIILDIMMPRVNGLHVLQTLKERSSTAKIPVIIVTGLAPGSFECYRDKAAAVVQKPFEREELLSHVDRILGVNRGDHPLPA